MEFRRLFSRSEASNPSVVVAEEDDNLWTISEDRLAVDLRRTPADPETAPYWREVIDANADRFVHPGNPNIVHPGQVLFLPSTGHELQPTPTKSEQASPNDERVEVHEQ